MNTQALYRAKDLELQSNALNVPKLKDENRELRAERAELKDVCDILDLYLKLYEGGGNGKDVLTNYLEL